MAGTGDRHGLDIYVGCLRTLIGNKDTVLYLLLGDAFLPYGSDSRERERLVRDSPLRVWYHQVGHSLLLRIQTFQIVYSVHIRGIWKMKLVKEISIAMKREAED